MANASSPHDDTPPHTEKEVIMIAHNGLTKALAAVACIGSLAFWYCGGNEPTSDVGTTTTTGASEPVQQLPNLSAIGEPTVGPPVPPPDARAYPEQTPRQLTTPIEPLPQPPCTSCPKDNALAPPPAWLP
jgi:hypothetical protein